MAAKYRKGGKQLPPVALGSPLSRENLPAPLVYYPHKHGAFFAFAASRDERPALCACAEGAVRNLLRLPPLDYALFPAAIADSLVGQPDPIAVLVFRPGLCHRCNRVAPSLRYCHEMDGPRFVQTYGWYINQTCLRLGIHPSSERYLPDVCPAELRDVMSRIDGLMEQARRLRAALAALMNDSRRDIPRSERSHWPNVTRVELAPLEAIERKLGKPRRELGNAVQNITRAEFGVRPVGEHWIRETELYGIVRRLFPGETVLFHHRPEWMDGLELDICVPGRKLALEYQGPQHFRPIKAWGGEAAFQQLQARDARKAQLCAQAGVRLVVVDYHEPLTEEHVRDRIRELLVL